MKKFSVKNRSGNSFWLRFGLLDLIIIVIVVALIVSSFLRNSNLEYVFNSDKKYCEISFVVRELQYDIYNLLDDGEAVRFADGAGEGKVIGKIYKGILSSSVYPDAFYTDVDGVLREVHYPDIYLDDLNNEFSEDYYSGRAKYDLSGILSSELILKNGTYRTSDGISISVGNTVRVRTRTVDLTIEILDISPVNEDKGK